MKMYIMYRPARHGSPDLGNVPGFMWRVEEWIWLCLRVHSTHSHILCNAPHLALVKPYRPGMIGRTLYDMGVTQLWNIGNLHTCPQSSNQGEGGWEGSLLALAGVHLHCLVLF
jgi:hypothetical protein